MLITQLEELEQSKVKVYIDNSYAFLLYQKDINQFELEEGKEITQDQYEKIMTDTVLRRAKQKALAVLKFMDRTEHELKNKLREADYPEEIIDQTIEYVKEYGYLDDERFTSVFVRSRMNTKSKLAIKTLLLQKGISKELAEHVLRHEYENELMTEDSELIAIRKAVAKKIKFPRDLSLEEKQKITASLYRKGFDLGKIKQVINHYGD